METSQKQTSLFGTDESTSSPGDSHASPTHKQENDWGKRTSDTSGRRCLERLKKLNHVGSWEKTFTELLIGQTGWSSKKCKLSWKMKGTKYNRIYFQLQVSTLPTKETEYGLLPTPRVSGQEGYETRAARKGHKVAMSYAEAGLLPTPRASEYKDTGPMGSKSHKHMLDRKYLCAVAQENVGTTGQLNPPFVEWMMGFPIGWTELKPLETQ